MLEVGLAIPSLHIIAFLDPYGYRYVQYEFDANGRDWTRSRKDTKV
jgi:hypothetical protein